MKRIIEIQGLDFHYKRQKKLLAGISLELRSGTIHGLLGKKGEGKTTLLKLISGLLFPLNGNISVLGFNPCLRQPKMLQEIFFLPEVIYSSTLSIEQFESIYAPFYPNFSSTYFYTYLSDFIIDPTTECINEMSYIQRKKFFIAFGLATNAKLLLLDEPTVDIDESSKEQLARVLSTYINDKCCMLITSQNLNDLSCILDNIIIIDNHEVVFSQTSKNISNKLFFSTSNKNESEKPIIHSIEGLEGYYLLCKNHTGAESEVNIDLLYHAVLENQAEINDIFNR